MPERSHICWETLTTILTAEHHRTYPRLRSALVAIDGMVGLTQVKETLCDQLLNILAFDQLHARNRTVPAVTRARSRCDRTVRTKTKTKWTRRKRRRIRLPMVAPLKDPGPRRALDLASLLMMADGGDTDEEEDEPLEPPIRPKHLADMNLHVLLCGPSGCGKSTLARRIAVLYEALGMVNGAFTTISRASVISRYQGASSERINGIIRKHQNGVVFVDEFYSFCLDGNDTFGSEMVTAIIEKMTDPQCTTTFICAGYQDAIAKNLFATNEGLERRFGAVHVITKPSLSELSTLFVTMMRTNGWKTALSPSQIEVTLTPYPALLKYNGGDVEALVAFTRRAHVRRMFPSTITRRATLADLKSGIQRFQKRKHRKAESSSACSLLYI